MDIYSFALVSEGKAEKINIFQESVLAKLKTNLMAKARAEKKSELGGDAKKLHDQQRQ